MSIDIESLKCGPDIYGYTWLPDHRLLWLSLSLAYVIANRKFSGKDSMHGIGTSLHRRDRLICSNSAGANSNACTAMIDAKPSQICVHTN